MAETIEQIAQRLARAMYGRFAVYGDKYEPHVEFSKALVAELVKEQKPVAIVRRGINAYSLIDTTGLDGIDGLPDGTAIYARPFVAVTSADAEATLDKPAKVGCTRFGVGIKWSTVIGAAQSLYEFEVTPDKEAERIKKAGVNLLALRTAIGAASADAVSKNPALTNAAADVLAERKRQVEAEGWTPEDDDRYIKRELSAAAECYVGSASARDECPAIWPWAREWWKPSDYRRNLVKAGALILAEIERLDRAAMASSREGA